MNSPIFRVFFIVASLAFSSCTAFKAMTIIKGGDAIFSQKMERAVPFTMDGHPIVIKARLNNSSKNYNFILDTGALTLIKQEVADELGLPKGLLVTARGSQGKTKNIQLVKLNSIALGGVMVRNCASGVITNESLFPQNIAGIIGSNFLRFFTLTIDFHENEILLNKNSPETQNFIPVTLEMKKGFAPFIKCTLDDKTEIKAMIDTGAPVTSLNLPLVKKTKEFLRGEAIKAMGSTSEGIGGRADENYVLRIKKIAMGNNIIKNLPVFSHGENSVQMIIGNDVLSKYRVIIDYPGSRIKLIPIGKKIDINPKSFGIAFQKRKGKTFIAGLWKNNSIKQSGIKVGDEVLKINSIETSKLSSLDLITIALSKVKSTMTMELKGKGKIRFVTLRREAYLPQIP